jgi:predicted alpha/beta-hydrolase family hydrolase
VRATLVLGHGAGGGIEAPDLQAVRAAAVAAGHAVVLVEQPWRVAGRKVAARPEALDQAWLACVRSLRARGPFVVGGRSAGARVACRTAVELGAAGVLALAFPLHPPGRPECSRAGELSLPSSAGIPVLVVQGERDTFGTTRELPALPDVEVLGVAGADHALTKPLPMAQILEWLDGRNVRGL